MRNKLLTIRKSLMLVSSNLKDNTAMDITRQIQSLSWCKPDWCFPSKSKETDELLRQCLTLPSVEYPEDVLEDIIKKSNNFPIPIPIETVKMHRLLESRPRENLCRNVLSTYPLIHERVLLLMTHFLIYKREFGSVIEKALYKDMTIVEFLDRILKKRAVAFFGPRDQYKLISGEQGNNGWEAIGTLQQKSPLILENCLSYDEMKLSAMVYVTGHTEFINDGSRRNSGVPQDENIERGGVIIGMIGTRLQRKLRMEYEDMLITEQQNSLENGYGEEVTPTTCLNVLKTTYVRNNQSSKHMWRQMWSEFYQVHSYTYEELTSYVNITEKKEDKQKYMDRYVKKPNSDDIFDNEVYYKRLSIAFDCTLLEANARAQVVGKMAYLNVVGIGLGVWMVSPHQTDVFLLTFLERIRSFLKKELLNYISDINFAYISPSDGIKDLFARTPILENKKHPNGGIAIQLLKREPSSKLGEQHSGKLLVTTYAWDGNAHPGNEFWIGSLDSSGDPAAACSTQVAELHNAHINDRVRASELRVAGAHGLLRLDHYCRKMLEHS